MGSLLSTIGVHYLSIRPRYGQFSPSQYNALELRSGATCVLKRQLTLDFNQVRYFLAVSDELNFTRAAEQCHVTQPALTQAIKRLETELGGELIHRDGRNTELTSLGKSLRSHFQQIDQTKKLINSTAKAVSLNNFNWHIPRYR